MNNLVDIRDIAFRLLHPNETLDVRLFDFYGQMHKEVREQLLRNASFVIKNTVGRIKGLKVKDIFLNGSSAGYFYHEKSDIDVRIEVCNESCSFVSKDGFEFARFLMVLQRGSLAGYKFTYNKRFIDISTKPSDKEIVGLYSILNDKWVLEPNQHIADDLNVEDVVSEYVKRLHIIEEHIAKMKKSGVLQTKEGIEQLEAYYRSFFEYNTSSIREYVVYKLLGYKGVFKDLKRIISQSWKDFLSLK